MARLPLAVIGCGLIGLRHARVAAGSDLIDLTAVVEPDPVVRQALCQQGLPAVASLADVPNKTRAAIIATPTPDHAASGLSALEQGWAVLVEKPLTGTLAQADALIASADRAGLPLIAGHHRRNHPFVQAAREKLGAIGDPVAVQGMWSLRKHDTYFDPDWRRAPGSGPLMTNLSHEIDLLRFFWGEIAEVSALSSNATRGHAIEDTSAISLRFECGALGSFIMSDAGVSPWAFEAASDENPHIAASGEDYARFSGTQGAMSFPSLTLWRGADGQDVNWQNPLVREAGPEFPKVDPIKAQIEHFAAVVDGSSTGVLADGHDGRATVEATLAAVLSAQTRRPVRRGDVPADYCGRVDG